jgi:glycosyltransferase involved in cell wall biosynthesis
LLINLLSMNIALDCERMKYPHTGLFEYCHQLGLTLMDNLAPEDALKYYVREKDKGYFNASDSFLIQNSLHKFVFPRYRNIDLWHTTYQISSYTPKSKKMKKVLTVHDLNFLYEDKPSRKQENYLRKHQKNIDWADHIVAISEFTKQDILKHLHVGNKPISVIYNGCTKGVADSGTQPAYIPVSPYLFGLGTVNPKKNFHVLVPLLQDNSYELIIAGKIEPAYKETIIKEAQKYNVSDRVKVIGPVSEQEKSWYYQHCEAFLFPSIAEGFGIPPIEAMQFGKPVFLSNTTSLPEIGGDVAYYFNSFDGEGMVNTFREGMAHYHRTQPAGAIIAHAATFTWEKCASAYMNVYRQTLNG